MSNDRLRYSLTDPEASYIPESEITDRYHLQGGAVGDPHPLPWSVVGYTDQVDLVTRDASTRSPTCLPTIYL